MAEPCSNANVPTGNIKLRKDKRHYACELPPREIRCHPMATMNVRGALIITRPATEPLDFAVVQLHGDEEQTFSTQVPHVEQDLWPLVAARYVIAFSATHVAVCAVLGDKTEKLAKYSISIRPISEPQSVDSILIEQEADPWSLCHSDATPVVSNGDGTLYTSDFIGPNRSVAVLTRYRLDNSKKRGWVCDTFSWMYSRGSIYCAAGDFVCMKDDGESIVFKLPAEIDQVNHRLRLHDFKVGGTYADYYSNHSLCLDVVGNALGVDVRSDHFSVWSYELATGTKRVLTTIAQDDFVRHHLGEFRRPRPVIHPSGRIFIMHEGSLQEGRRMVCAQELVKE